MSGDRLIRTLQQVGYSIVRQRGSHVRLRHPGPPVHGVTVPLHNPLKTGTLHGILAEVALYYSPAVDGRRFLINVAPEGAVSAPITVVLNWTAGLKR
ncbi:MAG: type II toxin-antitoxin system HicA family toxin [Bryobacterales bacterium]|nr:type II toxin-antitoxin system HicA family toxin [Bryobacterales bacterium]